MKDGMDMRYIIKNNKIYDTHTFEFCIDESLNTNAKELQAVCKQLNASWQAFQSMHDVIKEGINIPLEECIQSSKVKW